MNLIGYLFGPIINALNTIQASLTSLHGKVNTIMAKVQIDQEALDSFAAEISDSVAKVSDEIAKLVADQSNPLNDADVSALQAAVDSLSSLEPPAVEPAPEPPVA